FVGGAWGGARAAPSDSLGLRDRDHEADRRQDVAGADALGFGADLDHGLARVVDLPRELPALFLGAADRLHELLHDLLEGVAVTVVQDGHPWGRDRRVGALELLDVGG